MRPDRAFARRQNPDPSEHGSWNERLAGDESATDVRYRPVADPRAHRWSATGLGVVALVLVLLAAVLGAWLVSPDGNGGASAMWGSRESAASLPSSGARSAAAQDRQALESCRALYRLQRGVLDAARPAMRQWEVHIGAMNQLVAGTITLSQATAFWNSTRVRAAQRVQAFDTADRLFRSSSSSLCPEAATPSPTASSALRTCLDAVIAGRATVRAARTTMVTWSNHVRDMEHLRMGMLSPRMAERMWQQTWKRGDRELRTYRRDDAKAGQLRCPA